MKHTSAAVESFAALVLLIIIISSIVEKEKSRQYRAFLAMAIANECALIFEAISLMLYGKPGYDIMIKCLNLCAFLSGFLLTLCFLMYVYRCIEQNCQIQIREIKIAAVLCVISALALVAGARFDWFYEVRDGFFYMKPWFMLAFSYDIIGVMIAMRMILKYRNHLKIRDILALLSFPAMAIIAILMQYLLFRKASMIFTLTMLSCMMIYLMIQFDRMRQFYIQKQQMEEMYTQLMLSQIQPHFIFNSLSSIRRLIKKDADTAVKAVENFSLYLRKNLDSINSIHPVPFHRELAHTQEYLYMEKLRFGDRIQVEYNIQCTEFELPVLTMQPLVENAVKYGVLEKSGGGTILISTFETKDAYRITIEDNGVGFDPEEVHSEERTHVGIPNVRYRLHAQCRGELMITSSKGIGTNVEICIPKKK